MEEWDARFSKKDAQITSLILTHYLSMFTIFHSSDSGEMAYMLERSEMVADDLRAWKVSNSVAQNPLVRTAKCRHLRPGP
jgi:hypothetical protein